MITITYLKRPHDTAGWVGKWDEVGNWDNFCAHATNRTREGAFYADKFDDVGKVYRRISCQGCAVKLGIIW